MGQFSAKWMPIGVVSILHFLVDGLCVCLLYLMAEGSQGMADVAALFLTYNILAFMTQPLTGWWIDCRGRRRAALRLAACTLAAAMALQGAASRWWGMGMPSLLPVVFLLGMGNSLFHVWGGKLTATLTGNDMRALGVFVSTGVMGLAVGALYASWWLAAGMLLSVILLGAIPLRAGGSLAEAGVPPPRPLGLARHSWFWLFAVLTFVMLRSFVGEEVQAGLEKPSGVLLLLAVTAMAGKAAGGWLARWWGISHAIVACLGVAAACLMWCGAGSIPFPLVVAGVFAINCTMPMTLHLSNRLLPGREGLSFGLLAAVLIPGYMLAKGMYFSSVHCFMLSALLLTIAVEAGMLMLMGERRRGVLMASVAVNVLTNVPLNYFLLNSAGGTASVVAGELMVLLAEALWYFIFVRQWRTAAIYSLLCNATSFLAGVLLQYIIYYSL